MRISHFFVILTIMILIIPAAFHPAELEANPFLGNERVKKAAPPPVYSVAPDKLIKLQFEFREKIASALQDIKKDESGNILLIFLTASFVYGLFHAAGPGHRKTIIFSLFISQGARWYEPCAAGFLSAGIHAGISIAVIITLYLLGDSVFSLSGSEAVYSYMEGITFLIIAVFSFGFIICKTMKPVTKQDIMNVSMPHRLYPMIIITSLVPCPGATMLMLLSIFAGMPGAGIAGVISMSAGMGIVISFAGYLAYAGRLGLFSRLKNKEQLLLKISAFLELASFFIILCFSMFMSWPFVKSILK